MAASRSKSCAAIGAALGILGAVCGACADDDFAFSQDQLVEDMLAKPGDYPDRPDVPDSGVPQPRCVALPPPPESGRIKLTRTFEAALRGSPAILQAVDLVQHPTQDATWFLASQRGQVVRFQSDAESPSWTSVLDISAQLRLESSESGLVSFALHPKFADNGLAFAVYSATNSGGRFVSRLSRFQAAADGAFGREEVLLDIPQRSAQHTGNHIIFGPDGFLYYAVGDDRETDVNAQDPGTLKGKVLRLDVDHADEQRGTRYATPGDNPFADSGAPEVYAIGFRNPWRLSVDRTSGQITVADVGQDSREEIDILESGANYGWPMREGTLCFREDPCDIEGVTDPAAEVNHPSASSIVAGHVITGSRTEALNGRYLFADFIGGSMFSAKLDEPSGDLHQEVEGSFNIPTIAQGRDGAIYALRYEGDGDEGGVYRVEDNEEQTSDFPQRLSETACVRMDNPTQPATGTTAYTPIAPLWSDGAEKLRAFALPPDYGIVLDDAGDFFFPDGSVLIKHFMFDGAFVETRLMMRYEGTWTGYSYRWREGQSEADLVEQGTDTVLAGGQAWHFPSRSECNRCHTRAAGYTLGLELAQLDHTDAQGKNQIDALIDGDYFAMGPDAVSRLRDEVIPMPDPAGDGPTAARARAYLHANCSNCHRPSGPGRGDMDMRFSTSYDAFNACNEKPRVTRLWDLGNWGKQYLVVPGSKQDSTLYLRMTLQGLFRMPPLASEVVDAHGAALVGDWIDGLADCDAMKADFEH